MTFAKDVHVIGAGGHAKVIVRMLQDLGYKIKTIFDDNSRLWGTSLLGVPIAGPIESINKESVRPTLIAIGDNNIRRKIADCYNLPWLTAVHPQAFVDPSVLIGRGTVVLPRAVIQVDSTLGDHVIVNTGATIDHDCVIGSFAHLAPGVHLAGNVTIGNGVLLGIGAVATPGIIIGQSTTVGAGAAVISDLPNQVVAMGVPAKVKSQAQSSIIPMTLPDVTDCLIPINLVTDNHYGVLD